MSFFGVSEITNQAAVRLPFGKPPDRRRAAPGPRCEIQRLGCLERLGSFYTQAVQYYVSCRSSCWKEI